MSNSLIDFFIYIFNLSDYNFISLNSHYNNFDKFNINYNSNKFTINFYKLNINYNLNKIILLINLLIR